MPYPNPLSQVLLVLDKPLQDELITDSGLKLFIDPSYNKEQNVVVVATVVALPINSHPKDKKILDQLSVGDEVCISYSVVADFEFKGDRERYMETTEENPHMKEFANGKGETVKVYAMKKASGFGVVWVGMHQDKRGDIVDGVQGSEATVERWLSQFPFGKTDEYSFNNFFEYKSKDYWKCSLDQIFAKRVKKHLVAVGDRVICKPIDEDVPLSALPSTMHHSNIKIRHQDRGRVLTGGKEKGFKKDEIISFPPTKNEKYNFFGIDYFLVNQNYVTGKWN